MPKVGSDAAPTRQPDTGARAKREPLRSVAVARPQPRAIALDWLVWSASALFVALAILAHSNAYFPVDLTVTRTLQADHGHGLEALMFTTSWLGYFPQVAALSAVVVSALFATGLRREAGAALFATLGGGVGALVKLAVMRPRPSAELVQVLGHIPSSGFPSGHVLSTTAFCGFLVFLGVVLLAPSAGRTALIVVLSAVIALMGPSRIYLGQHWFSDVIGGYLLGGVWLALTIRFYRWGEARSSAPHSGASEVVHRRPA